MPQVYPNAPLYCQTSLSHRNYPRYERKLRPKSQSLIFDNSCCKVISKTSQKQEWLERPTGHLTDSYHGLWTLLISSHPTYKHHFMKFCVFSLSLALASTHSSRVLAAELRTSMGIDSTHWQVPVRILEIVGLGVASVLEYVFDCQY